jgi:hypothetical protein
MADRSKRETRELTAGPARWPENRSAEPSGKDGSSFATHAAGWPSSTRIRRLSFGYHL